MLNIKVGRVCRSVDFWLTLKKYHSVPGTWFYSWDMFHQKICIKAMDHSLRTWSMSWRNSLCPRSPGTLGLLQGHDTGWKQRCVFTKVHLVLNIFVLNFLFYNTKGPQYILLLNMFALVFSCTSKRNTTKFSFFLLFWANMAFMLRLNCWVCFGISQIFMVQEDSSL